MAIYFDHNATTAVDARVLEAMQPMMSGHFGNASSLHRFGRASRDVIDRARSQVAAMANAHAGQVIFTSGGTESNNTVLKGAVAKLPPGRMLISAIEHPSVLETEDVLRARGWQVELIPALSSGVVDLEALKRLLGQGDVRLVSVMCVNNETGVVQPVEEISALAKDADALMHCDAVQAAGKLPLDFAASGADFMSLSSHKIYGPKGAGALLVDKRIDFEPLLHGGGHERGMRSGTENMPAIAGFGVAAELASVEREQRAGHCQALRDRLETGLQAIAGVQIFGQAEKRLPNTSQFSVPGYDGEALLMALDREAIAVSSGSACDSGKGEPSHVLIAMGIEEQVARGAIRVSFGKDNTVEEVDQFLQVLGKLVGSSQNTAADRFASVMGQ